MADQHPHDHDQPEDHDLGLSHDLPALLSRRRALGLFGGAGLVATLAACTSSGASNSDPTTSSATSATTATSSSASTAVSTPSTSASTSTSAGVDAIEGGNVDTSSDGSGEGEIPEETGGPFPGDGSNGPNVLTASGVVRSDLRSSFGDYSGTAEGVELTVRLTVVDVSGSADAGTPVKGAAIYAWHCNRDGEYSLYGVTDQNYLRGVQATDANGTVTFTTIFPAAYSGRWPHIHFEVYPTLTDATSASNRRRTSQLALPKAACDEVYATTGYEASVGNLAQTSLDTDMVFSDGYALQLAKVTGSAQQGYTATLRVPV